MKQQQKNKVFTYFSRGFDFYDISETLKIPYEEVKKFHDEIYIKRLIKNGKN